MSTPQMQRILGVWGAAWLGLGSIVGTGVFVSLGIATGIVGSGVVVAVALAALVATANGLSSAQLAAAHPVSGGTYEYGHRFVHPYAGFIAGWLFLCAKSASAATAALGCATYFLYTLDLDNAYGPTVGIAGCLVVVFTILTASGLRRSTTVNFIVVLVTLVALALFVLFAWLNAQDIGETDGLSWSAITKSIEQPQDLLHAAALLFVAYAGYGRIATLGEEVKEPRRTIPRAIIITLVAIMAIYLLVTLSSIATVGANAFAAAVGERSAPLEVIASTFEQQWVSTAVAIGAITAMLGVLLNLLLGLSRVLLAMARRQEMPPALAALAANGSPVRAQIAVGIIIASLVAIGDVRTTWTFSAFTVLGYYGITNLAALLLPREQRFAPRWIAWFGLLSCIGLAFFVPWRVWLVGLGLIALGVVFRLSASRVWLQAKEH